MAGTVKRQRRTSEEAEDESATTEKRKKNSRSRNGCLTCRARKIKCDESPESCLNCERIHVVCPGYGNTQINRSELNQLQSKSSDAVTEAGIRRSRSLMSCEACRRAKTKCVRDGPACSRCLQKNVPCIFKATDSDPPMQDASHVEQTGIIHPDYQDRNINYGSFDFQDIETVYHCPNPGNPEDGPSAWGSSSIVADQARVPKLKWTFTLSRPTDSID
ncbi:hypothetical protein F5Y09DRAFT_341232 [Xylaria sp. FL1042]|nr:hypothetical protein F5Y09DRAFT_341232 [Xylaria sp. FL1042]